MDPFAPVQRSDDGPAGPTQPCTGCGAPVDPGRAQYSDAGEMVCARCAAGDTIATGENRAAGSILSAGVGSLVFGITGWLCINPFFIFSVLAITSGVFGTITLVRQKEYQRVMGSKYELTLAMAIIGAILGALRILLGLLGIAVLETTGF